MSKCENRTNRLKFKAWDISIPLPVNPEPNSIFYVKDGTEYEMFPVDSSGNYLTLKHPTSSGGGGIYGSELSVFTANAVLTNTTDTPQDVINVSTPSLPLGQYAIKISYSWNSNCTQHDFESFFTFGGASISNDASGLIHKEEPKDSAGQWNGTNSLQMLHFSREYTVDVTTAGVKNVLLSFRSSMDTVMASIWDVDIKIYRIN